MGDLAKIVDPGVEAAAFQVGMGRAPEAEIDERAGVALF
jgi:hypothetical protein